MTCVNSACDLESFQIDADTRHRSLLELFAMCFISFHFSHTCSSTCSSCSSSSSTSNGNSSNSNIINGSTGSRRSSSCSTAFLSVKISVVQRVQTLGSMCSSEYIGVYYICDYMCSQTAGWRSCSWSYRNNRYLLSLFIITSDPHHWPLPSLLILDPWIQ